MLKNNKENIVESNHNEDKYNFVLYVPEIIHKDWKIVDGKVLLNFEVKNPITKFAGFLAKKKPKRDIQFDNMCTSAWLLIDGKSSIYEIARIQSQNTNDEFKEDLRRLIEFIKYISKHRWIRYKGVKKREEIK